MERVNLEGLKPKKGSLRFIPGEPDEGEPSVAVDIEIPLEPFNPKLSHENRSIETSFRLEDTILEGAATLDDLDGKTFKVDSEFNSGSIYLGSAHNPVDISSIRFQRIDDRTFKVNCKLFCDFEFENVAKSETVKLEAILEMLTRNKGWMASRWC